ncbi:UNVERIFIED_CONTAM: hypothetical protein FKN15_051582 [Acipenser sinensis]
MSQKMGWEEDTEEWFHQKVKTPGPDRLPLPLCPFCDGDQFFAHCPFHSIHQQRKIACCFHRHQQRKIAVSTSTSRGRLLFPPPPAEKDYLQLPPPPAEGDYLQLPPSPPEGDCLQLPLPPPEGDYPQLPPPQEGDYLQLPPPPQEEGPGCDAGIRQQPLHRLLRGARGKTAGPQQP